VTRSRASQALPRSHTVDFFSGSSDQFGHRPACHYIPAASFWSATDKSDIGPLAATDRFHIYNDSMAQRPTAFSRSTDRPSTIDLINLLINAIRYTYTYTFAYIPLCWLHDACFNVARSVDQADQVQLSQRQHNSFFHHR
jgi:hypothetical protein